MFDMVRARELEEGDEEIYKLIKRVKPRKQISEKKERKTAIAGITHVNNMRILAARGSGLNSYINRNVKFLYDR